jgi:hypothetical protein
LRSVECLTHAPTVEQHTLFFSPHVSLKDAPDPLLYTNVALIKDEIHSTSDSVTFFDEFMSSSVTLGAPFRR